MKKYLAFIFLATVVFAGGYWSSTAIDDEFTWRLDNNINDVSLYDGYKSVSTPQCDLSGNHPESYKHNFKYL